MHQYRSIRASSICLRFKIQQVPNIAGPSPPLSNHKLTGHPKYSLPKYKRSRCFYCAYANRSSYKKIKRPMDNSINSNWCFTWPHPIGIIESIDNRTSANWFTYRLLINYTWSNKYWSQINLRATVVHDSGWGESPNPKQRIIQGL